MKISLECSGCKVSELYIQSLVLLYLPLEKFGKNDDNCSLELFISKSEFKFFGKAELVFQQTETLENQTVNYEDFPLELDAAKNFVGRLIIGLFSKRFGFTPEWGMITGVKPARFAYDLSQKGFSDNKILELLKKCYLVQPQKAELSLKLSKIDKEVKQSSSDYQYSLYAGIPFCPTRCRYCSFVSCSTKKLGALLPDYIEKLLSEISSCKQTADKLGLTLKSLYVGGGTPSILDERLLAYFLEKLREYIHETDIEFTFEAGRPDTVTQKKLSLMKASGVNRVCINTQTTDNKILSSLGRGHTFEQYKDALFMAKDFGFVVNTDLIAGLPGETLSGFCKSVDDVLSLRPENITVHSFSLKKSSEYTVSGVRLADNTDIAKMLEYSEKTLCNAGYFPYYMYKHKNTAGNLENVGYSDKKGNICLYNIYMMEGIHSVIACGAGASSKLVSKDSSKSESIYNPKYPYEYLEASYDTRKKEKEIIDFYNNKY